MVEILIPIVGLIGLGFAIYLIMKIMALKVDDEKMEEISRYIQEGAMAFLKREYLTIFIFVLVVFGVLYAFRGAINAVSFITGAFLSGLAGFIGMYVATRANARTTSAAKKGMSHALEVAFSGGAVMGMSVASFGLLGLGILYYFVRDPQTINGFALGASSIALFARVGGGIYTKAADVGADLVGKVEEGIPEDDPRNPGVIADNVGDNVGDVAGMGADLFESYVGSIVATMVLGATLTQFKGTSAGVLYPMFLAAAGVLSAIVGALFVKAKEGDNLHSALNRGTFIAGGLVLVLSLILSLVMFKGFGVFMGTISGLIAGIIIGLLTEYYTSYEYNPVKQLSESAKTGPATVIIRGMALGMGSTALPLLVIAVAILIAYKFAGIYGIAVSAVGMLSITGMTVAVDAYGPIADNAGGIAEMSGQDPSVREITDSLDALGNTTAAIGKGFAIGSAALTALALFSAYSQAVGLKAIDLINPKVVAGLFIGGIMPYLLSSLALLAVGKTAFRMIEEIRRQFREIPGIMEGKGKPDYAKCVAISTQGALKEMIIPGVSAVVAPIIVGLVLGPQALGGFLAGALIVGVLVAIMMANAGGAWDNAKKYIEQGHFGGKGSEAHAAAVVGDTVGDPFKDTAGPSMNILIKLMSIVSLVFAPLFMR